MHTNYPRPTPKSTPFAGVQGSTVFEGCERLLTLAEVLELVRVCRSSWYAGIDSGIYPAAVRIGRRSVRWRLSDIRALLEKGVQ
ncbi:MAG: helix-turn-helix domain-containing protein [Rhizobiales bacterium]|nr:helix-turn-helix domain-containing protein [Hyphomicrobiales bacterium]